MPDHIKSIIAVVASILLFSCSESKEVKLQRFLLKGNEEAIKKNYSYAENYYREALKLDSCFADGWNNLGTIQYQQNKLEEAADSYTRAIACSTGYVAAHFNRSNVYIALKKYTLALQDLDHLSKVKPDTLVLLLSKGIVYTGLHQYDQAEEVFVQALKANPDDVDVLVNLGIVNYYQHELDTAEIILLKAMKLKADEANIYNALSLIEMDRENFTAAHEWIDKALSLKPKDPYYLNNRGYIYLLTNNLSRSREDFDLSISLDPYNPWAYRNKGWYYIRTGDHASAIRVLSQAEEMDSGIEKLNYYLAEAYYPVDKVKACMYFEKALTKQEVTEEYVRKKCK